MVKYLVLTGIVLSSVMVMAQDDETDAEKKVNAQEIIYDQPTEWSVYPADEPVTAFTIKGDELWYATSSSAFKASIKKRLVQKFDKLGSMEGTDITCMATNGANVWIGGKNGVAMGGSKGFTVFTADNGLPGNSVNALVADGPKTWVGTDDGLACYSNGSWKVFTTKNGLSNNKVQALVTDDKGRVWIGTAKGVCVYDGSSFTVWDMKKGMSWNNVKALAFDPRKMTVWAAVGEKDVNSFAKDKCNVFMDISEGITSLMVDSQSRVWVGTTSGLVKYNGDEWINDPKKLNIPAAQVQWMQRDGAGNLYYACENGIVRLSNPYPY
jgi:ligand-binding sensor domain-containing protein